MVGLYLNTNMSDNSTDPRPNINGAELCAKLNEIFDDIDPLIDEIGFLVSIQQSDLENQNQIQSPFNQHFFLSDHKFGVCYSVLPSIARVASEKYQNYCSKSEKEQMDVNNVNIFKTILRSLLMVNGDNYTAWNKRKQLVLAGHITLEEELYFSSLMLTKHKKSTETWAHRRWVLERLWHDRILTVEDCRKEFELCAVTAKTRVRNYYAWSHRLWCLKRADIKTYLEDYKWVQAWNKSMLSDYSAWHHREEILNAFLEYERRQHGEHIDIDVNNNIEPMIKLHMKPIWIRELEDNRDFILDYAGHEALWMYRRFLYSRWIQIQLDEQSFDIFAVNNNQVNSTEGTLQAEISFVQSVLVNQNLDEYGRSNRKWAGTYARWILPRIKTLLLQEVNRTSDDNKTIINSTIQFLDAVTSQLKSVM